MYQIKITFPYAGALSVLVAHLQTAYDNGNVAGFFNVDVADGEAIVVFDRSLSDDYDCLDDRVFAGAIPQKAACEQLAAEFAEVDLEGFRMVVEALRSSGIVLGMENYPSEQIAPADGAITGADLKNYFNDHAYWGEGYVDDVCILVDGENYVQEDRLSKISDFAKVEIKDGFVVLDLSGKSETISLVKHFSVWLNKKKQQQPAVNVLRVEVDDTHRAAVIAAIAAAGGRVTS